VGIGELWLTHGPGSPGSVAKAISKSYMSLKKRFPNATQNDLLMMTLKERINIGVKLGVAPLSDEMQEIIIKDSGENLEKLINRIIRHENPNANAAMSDPQVYFAILSVIGKVVSKYTT